MTVPARRSERGRVGGGRRARPGRKERDAKGMTRGSAGKPSRGGQSPAGAVAARFRRVATITFFRVRSAVRGPSAEERRLRHPGRAGERKLASVTNRPAAVRSVRPTGCGEKACARIVERHEDRIARLGCPSRRGACKADGGNLQALRARPRAELRGNPVLPLAAHSPPRRAGRGGRRGRPRALPPRDARSRGVASVRAPGGGKTSRRSLARRAGPPLVVPATSAPPPRGGRGGGI